MGRRVQSGRRAAVTAGPLRGERGGVAADWLDCKTSAEFVLAVLGRELPGLWPSRLARLAGGLLACTGQASVLVSMRDALCIASIVCLYNGTSSQHYGDLGGRSCEGVFRN